MFFFFRGAASGLASSFGNSVVLFLALIVLSTPETASAASGISQQNPRDAMGWTVLTPSGDSRFIYVSSSDGDNDDDGLTPETAKETITAGRALLRHGFPDWILLKKGDVFDESLGHIRTSGRSKTEPQVWTSYGVSTVRPLLRTGTDLGMITFGGGGSPPRIDYVAIIGLHFLAHTHNGSSDNFAGGQFLMPGDGLLIEDCRFERYGTGLTITAPSRATPLEAVELRRNVIIDSFTTREYHSQGLYSSAVDGLLVEENVVDYNGWNANIPGANANIFRHDIYLSGNLTDDTQIVGNLITRGASHGVQARSGGHVVDNLFARNSINLLIGDGENTGYSALVEENILIDPKNISPTENRGWGIHIQSNDYPVVRANILTSNIEGAQPSGIVVQGETGDPIRAARLKNNLLYNWRDGIRFYGDSSGLLSVELTGNEVQSSGSERVIEHDDMPTTFVSSNNRFWSQAPPSSFIWLDSSSVDLATWQAQIGDLDSTREQLTYPDPDRSIARYNAEVLGGPADFEAFMDEARNQSKDNWRPEYTAEAVNRWIREGFGRVRFAVFGDGFESGDLTRWSNGSL